MGFANLDISRHPDFLSAQSRYENREPQEDQNQEKTFYEKLSCASIEKIGLIKKVLLERLRYEKVEYLLECVEDACDESELKDFLKQEIEPLLEN